MCKNRHSASGKLLDSATWDALVKAGVPEQELLTGQASGPVIFSYSRADAIRDGVLVDLTARPETASLVRQAGFKVPLAMTATAYGQCVGFGPLPIGQSALGRLWDVLTVLRSAISAAASAGDTDRVHFQVSVDEKGDGHRRTVQLWCLCGPGDNAEPTLTILLEVMPSSAYLPLCRPPSYAECCRIRPITPFMSGFGASALGIIRGS